MSEPGKPVAPLNDVLQPNYPRNLWWFALRTSELGETPLDMWLLDRPVVFYRRSNGEAVALENRCPHRWAPLSMGRVEGDSIRCPYHGFKFAPTGECTNIPSQDLIPRNCRVMSYPLIERHGTIWIWMGDPALATAADLPVDTAWLVNKDWSVGGGCMVIDANYQLLKENVLDLTHLPFLHPTTIGLNDWSKPPKVTVEDGVVTYREEFDNTYVPETMAHMLGFAPAHRVKRSNIGRSPSPAAHHSTLIITDLDAAPGSRNRYELSIFHLTTPESVGRFRYNYFTGWNVQLPPQMKQMFANPPAFQEDKTMLEAVQRMIERDPRGINYPEIIVRADEAAVQSRRRLRARLQEEQGQAD